MHNEENTRDISKSQNVPEKMAHQRRHLIKFPIAPVFLRISRQRSLSLSFYNA